MIVFKSIDELAKSIGQEIGVSDWLQVDQAHVNAFAELTGDRQWIHIDVERATRELPTKGTIVQGLLTLSLVGQLLKSICDYEGVSRKLNYGLNKVRFPNIVPTGSRLRLRLKLLAAEKRAGGTQFTFEYIIEIEGAERPACTAEHVVLMYP
jgi:acyl dehydratase